jgi:hypothetical protein
MPSTDLSRIEHHARPEHTQNGLNPAQNLGFGNGELSTIRLSVAQWQISAESIRFLQYQAPPQKVDLVITQPETRLR